MREYESRESDKRGKGREFPYVRSCICEYWRRCQVESRLVYRRLILVLHVNTIYDGRRSVMINYVKKPKHLNSIIEKCEHWRLPTYLASIKQYSSWIFHFSLFFLPPLKISKIWKLRDSKNSCIISITWLLFFSFEHSHNLRNVHMKCGSVSLLIIKLNWKLKCCRSTIYHHFHEFSIKNYCLLIVDIRVKNVFRVLQQFPTMKYVLSSFKLIWISFSLSKTLKQGIRTGSLESRELCLLIDVYVYFNIRCICKVNRLLLVMDTCVPPPLVPAI